MHLLAYVFPSLPHTAFCFFLAHLSQRFFFLQGHSLVHLIFCPLFKNDSYFRSHVCSSIPECILMTVCNLAHILLMIVCILTHILLIIVCILSHILLMIVCILTHILLMIVCIFMHILLADNFVYTNAHLAS